MADCNMQSSLRPQGHNIESAERKCASQSLLLLRKFQFFLLVDTLSSIYTNVMTNYTWEAWCAFLGVLVPCTSALSPCMKGSLKLTECDLPYWQQVYLHFWWFGVCCFLFCVWLKNMDFFSFSFPDFFFLNCIVIKLSICFQICSICLSRQVEMFWEISSCDLKKKMLPCPLNRKEWPYEHLLEQETISEDIGDVG